MEPIKVAQRGVIQMAEASDSQRVRADPVARSNFWTIRGTAADQDMHVILDSVPALVAAIEDHLQHYNEAPRRFIWTKDADMILDKIAKCPKPLTA